MRTGEFNEYLHPSAWTAAELAGRSDWITYLTPDDVSELENALAHIKKRGISIPHISRDDFPLPTFSGKLDTVRQALEDGVGIALIRGLPVDRYTKADAAAIYWGIGSHIGRACAQNAQGDMLGHVRDLGADLRSDMRARGYQTRNNLPFHGDATDIVGLLCLRKSKSGGASRIVSASKLYNVFAATRPDLCRLMAEPFYADRRGEEVDGRKPYYVRPCFSFQNGRLYVWHTRTYIESAQRFPEVPRLTAQQYEALDYLQSLCNDPQYCFEMDFEPGDMQFLCNYTVFHSRTEYEDWPEPERKRHLLRLWLRTPFFSDLPQAFEDRNADMLAWQRSPRAPIFDTSEIASQLEH